MKKNRTPTYKKITVAVFALILFALPVLSAVFFPPEFSENENRYLARFPSVSLRSDGTEREVTDFESFVASFSDKWNVFSSNAKRISIFIEEERFMTGFEDWVDDHTAFREQWIVLKNNVERLLGKKEISGVFTADNQMMQVWRDYDENLSATFLKAIDNYAKRYPETPTYMILAPTSQEIYSDKLPPFVTVASQKDYIRQAFESMPNVTGIDVLPVLEQAKDSYIYYRTDHHWTSYGAYLAYVQAAKQLGLIPYDLSAFTVEHAAGDFRGTLYSKTLDSSITPDIIDIYTLSAGDPTVTMEITNIGKTTHDGLYFREYLDKKDKYSVYLGEMVPCIDIRTDVQNGGSLLIFKDSYAQSLIPFLSKHYSRITVLDLRYFNVAYTTFANPENYDQTLFIYNVLTFNETASALTKLNLVK
jgi:hypothetical protein